MGHQRAGRDDAEPSRPVVVHGGRQLGLGVHHERPVPGHRLANRSSSENDHLQAAAAVLTPVGHHPQVVARAEHSELAERALFSRSRLSHAVVRLEERGLVLRETCPTDRRGTFAVLTARGHDVVEGAAPGHVAAVRRMVFDRLGPSQVAQLESISTAIRRAVAAEREGAA